MTCLSVEMIDFGCVLVAVSILQVYLDEEKKRESDSRRGEKRRALLAEVEELKSKRARLQSNLKSLYESADELSLEAAKARKMSEMSNMLEKSNALRQSAKEKDSEVITLTKLIEEKELEGRSEL